MFWIVAGLLSAGAALLVLAASGHAARAAARGPEDPTLAIYRRQLVELDDLAVRGLLAPDAHAGARAEAGRRLLGHADAAHRLERPGARASRTAVMAAAAAAALVAGGAYLAAGAPGAPDQPYQRRLAAWRREDPATLDPARMAAVLRTIVAERPRDAQAWEYYGRAQSAAGDAYGAARSLRIAVSLSPGRADLLTAEGEALTADNDGKISDEAQAAFTAAVRLDPKSIPARYYLGQAKIAAGDPADGLAEWRALAADLPPNDPRRALLQAAIARGGAPQPVAAVEEGSTTARTGFIRAMVARQAARLRAHPDDPQGWARLVRSYGVLGDSVAQTRALNQARGQFAGRPDALRLVTAEAPGR